MVQHHRFRQDYGEHRSKPAAHSITATALSTTLVTAAAAAAAAAIGVGVGGGEGERVHVSKRGDEGAVVGRHRLHV